MDATVFIQKRKRKTRNRYAVYFKDPGTLKLKYFRTFQRQKDANQAAHTLRTLIDTAKTPVIEKTKINLYFLTFDKVACSLKEKWTQHLEKRKNLAQKTFNEYSIRLNVLKRIFGKKLLCEISRVDIKTYIDNLSSMHSNVTANRSLSILKKVLRHGLKLKAVINDPSEEIKFLSEKEQICNRFLLPHELYRLIEASQNVRAKHYLPALIYLGAKHGASKQEVLFLNWKHIDFDYAGRGTIRFFRTKNNRERIEFLMPRTKEALLAWRDHQHWMRYRKKVKPNGSNFVFCRLNGTPIKKFYSAWRTLCKAAGIDDFHFHDLRQTFCSNLILSGSGLKEAKEMISHSDISMTDRYSHLTVNHTIIRQEQLAKYYTKGR